jgi:protein-S-isoprenylcysteine O-methyltransferase Ste14
MTRPTRPLLTEFRDEVDSLEADLRQMVVLRWQLASLEVQTAVRQIKRLSLVLLIFAVMVLSAAPILAVAAAASLAGGQDGAISFVQWLLIFGLGLLIGGAAGGYLAWRRFRRSFVGIEQTLEELREDGVWLREWVGGGEALQEQAADQGA